MRFGKENRKKKKKGNYHLLHYLNYYQMSKSPYLMKSYCFFEIFFEIIFGNFSFSKKKRKYIPSGMRSSESIFTINGGEESGRLWKERNGLIGVVGIIRNLLIFRENIAEKCDSIVNWLCLLSF